MFLWGDSLAGVTGFEPMMTESESVALPLGDTPKFSCHIIIAILVIFFKRFYISF